MKVASNLTWSFHGLTLIRVLQGIEIAVRLPVTSFY